MESTSQPQSHGAEENSSPTHADNNVHQDSQYELISGSDHVEQEHKETPRRPSYWSHLFLDTWFSEILAISFSLSCFIAIVAVLSSFDGKQSPELSYGLRLNTIVSILATACKSSLLFLVAESLGQLKWVWFFQQGKEARKRPLHDIQLFDGASRGPLGSIIILFGYKGLSLASLGAAITLLSLAFDPFIQQIIDYPLGEITRDSDLAVAKQAVGFEKDHDKFSNSQIRNSVNAGIWTDNFKVNTTCPSGNCTWPSFDSVGWCSQCEDVTASAVLVGCDNATLYIDNKTAQNAFCDIVLPLGKPGMLQMTFDSKGDLNQAYIPKDIVWTVSDRISRDHPSYAGVKNPHFVIAHAKFAWSRARIVAALETKQISFNEIKKVTQCAMTPCSRTYNISVSNGATTIHTSAPNFGETFIHKSRSCWKKDKGAQPNLIHSNDSRNSLEDTSAMASCNWEMFRQYGFPNGLTGIHYGEFFYGDMDYFLDYNRLEKSDADSIEEIASTGLDQVTTRIANSLTKLALDKSNFTITGTMSHTKTFVAVRWKWITLPAAVVLLSLAFLLTTILTNSRQKRLALWKSSVLPFLYHGIDSGRVSIPDGEKVAVVSAMEVDAKGAKVQLEESERGRLLFR